MRSVDLDRGAHPVVGLGGTEEEVRLPQAPDALRQLARVLGRRNAAASRLRCPFNFTGCPRSPDKTLDSVVMRSISVEISC